MIDSSKQKCSSSTHHKEDIIQTIRMLRFTPKPKSVARIVAVLANLVVFQYTAPGILMIRRLGDT